MPDHDLTSDRHRRDLQRVALLTTLLVAAMATMLAAAGVAVGAGATPKTSPPPALTFEIPPTEITYRLNKQDRTAIKNRTAAQKLQSKADKRRESAAAVDARIAQIDELLALAAGDEQRLREALEQRLVAEYKSNQPDGLSFLFAARSLDEILTRAATTRQQAASTASIAASHEISLSRLEDLRLALQDLSDQTGDDAARIEDHANELHGTLAAARESHVNEVVELEDEAGTPGTWYVMGANVGGMFQSAWSGAFGGQYNGGIRTPRRLATDEQIQRVIVDPRIQVYAGGISDIRMGRVDGRLLDALTGLADQFGSVIVTSLISGHGVYTASGNVSEHSFGCAADIGSLAGIRIEPSTQGPGSITEQGVQYLSGLQGDLAPHQVISLYSYGGSSLAMADHGDHIHLGYSCADA